MTKKQKSLVGKFLKGVLAGGLASVAVSLETTPMTDLSTLLNILSTAFISGIVLSAMKYLTWEE